MSSSDQKTVQVLFWGVAMGLAVLLLALTSPAEAQDAPRDERSEAVVSVLACREEDSRRRRASCLSAALERLASAFPELNEEAQRLGEEAVTARGPVGRDEDFGAEDLPAELAEGLEEDQEQREMSSTVVSTSRTLSGDLVFVLANGQVWQQLSSDRGDPSVPSSGRDYAVTVRRGFIGSHFLKIEDERPAIRVRRIR